MSNIQGHGTVTYAGGPRHGQTWTGPLYWRLEFFLPQEPVPVTWPPDPAPEVIEYRRGWYLLENDGQWPDLHWWYEFGGVESFPSLQEAR